MSYQSLARKYRPKTFQDLLGQDAVTTALVNAIRLQRIPPTIIFTGVRGIGKTTTARLYAKAINCDKGPTANPCDVCESCRAIAGGYHEDVMEIDGASNTSVDHVRSLQETLEYKPQRSRFKVYIIDEVHMLSQSAFNALLKTLEEPPPDVIFIFATTEFQKIPKTIVGRCQTFHLQKLPLETIIKRLRDILSMESIPFEDAALVAVAREGQGSMRDALTFLDQAIAISGGEITLTALKGLLSKVSGESTLRFLAAALQRDAKCCLDTIAEWDQEGVDWEDVIENVVSFSRHAFIISGIGVDGLETAMLGITPHEIERLAALTKQAQAFDLNRIFRTFMKCRTELTGSALDRFVFENYSLEWCLDPGLPDLESLRSGAGIKVSAPPTSGSNVAPLNSPAAVPQTPPGNGTAKVNLREQWKKNLTSGDKQAAVLIEKPVEKPVEIVIEVTEKLINEASPMPHNQSTPSPITSQEKVFPDSWRDLVDQWKRQKPLQARIMEEAYLVEYSQQRIIVAADVNSMAAAKLLQREIQKKVEEQLALMFGFKGEFRVVPRTQDAGEIKLEDSSIESPNGSVSAASQESLLDIRRRETEDNRKKLKIELENHPLTLSAVKLFDGTIESVEMND